MLTYKKLGSVFFVLGVALVCSNSSLFAQVKVEPAIKYPTNITCTVAHAQFDKETGEQTESMTVKLTVTPDFAGRGSKEYQSAVLKRYKAELIATPAYGGDSNVVFIISRDGQMIHKTLWQDGDPLMRQQGNSGMNSVMETSPGSGDAEVQYRCFSK
jgi:hypothetical protein